MKDSCACQVVTAFQKQDGGNKKTKNCLISFRLSYHHIFLKKNNLNQFIIRF